MIVRRKRTRTVRAKRKPSRSAKRATELSASKRSKRKKREPKGVGTARKRIVSDINPIDIGERGPTGPASI